MPSQLGIYFKIPYQNFIGELFIRIQKISGTYQIQYEYLSLLNISIVMPQNSGESVSSQNVYGQALINCCLNPMTGFYRNGKCSTSELDLGAHVVCAELTSDFLQYSKIQGNDLMTPAPQFGFPGLKEGDRWCLCACRWKQAQLVGKAPKVDLMATEKRALDFIDFDILKQYSST